MEKSFEELEREELQMFEKKIRHLNSISRVIKKNSNALSSYYAYKRVQIQKDRLGTSTWLNKNSCQCCWFCGGRIVPGADRFRLSPRMRLSYKLQKLIRGATVKRIRPYQRSFVDKFLNSTNCLKIKCSSCCKTSVVPCQSRQNREQQRSKMSQSDTEKISREKTRKQKRKEKKNRRRKEKLEKHEEGLVAEIQMKNKTVSSPSMHNIRASKSFQQHKTVTKEARNKMVIQNARDSKAQQKPSSMLVLSALQQGGMSEGEFTKKDNKTKNKQYHQQLALMLKGEKKEQKNTSLKDFLCSM